MKDEVEDIFEGIDDSDNIEDEIVSSDSPEIEEQPTMDVPPNSNKSGLSNGFKSARDFNKINKNTISRLNDIKNKPQSIPNGITNKNEEEKSGLEQAKDNITSKAASAGITSATGGVVSGPIADAAGKVATELVKKRFEKKKKMIILAASIVGIFILFIVLIFLNDDDESNTSVITNNYVVGNMGTTELLNYLAHIGVCPSQESLQETFGNAEDILLAIKDSNTVIKSCTNAVTYYMALKASYKENLEDCKENRIGSTLPNFWDASDGKAKFRTNPKASTYFIGNNKDNYCQVNLPSQLIMETMSYGLDDQELFHPEYTDRYVDYKEDVNRLSRATTEFVHESCYMWEYWNSKTKSWQSSPCEHCGQRTKRNKDGYYFQISFDKYISYLKYGDKSDHPNYSGLPLEKGENYDHECEGPFNANYQS